jgi:GDP-L-fucose synthase
MHNAKIYKKTTFDIWGSGSPMREFLYVSELADCIEHLIDLDTNIDLLNVGSGQEVTIKELAKKIKDTIGFEGELKFDNTMPDGNPRKLLDSSLINELGWESKIDLDEGLAKTYEWYLDNEDTLRS